MMALGDYDVCYCKHERRIHEAACRGYTIWPTGERYDCPCSGFDNGKERVELPDDWCREGMVVVVDSESGRLLGSMGKRTWEEWGE